MWRRRFSRAPNGTLPPHQPLIRCADEIYNLALGHIQSVIKVGQGPWSSIEIRKTEVSGGRGLIGVFSGKRERLVAKWDNYKIYICSRPYGTDLDVNWTLTLEQGYLQKLITESTGIMLSSLNAFQLEDMRAFVSLIHRGVITAVDTIMQQAGLDSSKIGRVSKGFLGVS